MTKIKEFMERICKEAVRNQLGGIAMKRERVIRIGHLVTALAIGGSVAFWLASRDIAHIPYSGDVGGGDVVVSAIDPVGSMQSIDKERLSLVAGKVRSMLADAVAEA